VLSTATTIRSSARSSDSSRTPPQQRGHTPNPASSSSRSTGSHTRSSRITSAPGGPESRAMAQLRGMNPRSLGAAAADADLGKPGGCAAREQRRIPGFRWWEKKTRRLIVSNHPKTRARSSRRVSKRRRPAGEGGASIGNLLSGDAPRSFLTARRSTIRHGSSAAARARLVLHQPVQLRPVDDPIDRRGHQGARAGARRGPQRIAWTRAFPYPSRDPTNVLLAICRPRSSSRRCGAGRPRSYVDFVDYDEIAHHSGPDRVEARDAVGGLDKIIGSSRSRRGRTAAVSLRGALRPRQSPAMFADRIASRSRRSSRPRSQHVKVQARPLTWSTGQISPLPLRSLGING